MFGMLVLFMYYMCSIFKHFYWDCVLFYYGLIILHLMHFIHKTVTKKIAFANSYKNVRVFHVKMTTFHPRSRLAGH